MDASRQMIEEGEDHLTRSKIAGVVFALLLTAGALGAMGWGDGSVEPRMESAARQTPGMIFWWREDVNQMPLLLGLVLSITPMLLVPGAFGVRFRRMLPTLRPRWRAALVAALAALIAADALAYRQLGGRDIGVATIEGAKWLRNGSTREQWGWEQATRVSGGCWTNKRYSWSDPTFGLEYLVHFPDGRDARLSFRIQEIGSWSSSLQTIDDRLTAAGVRRTMDWSEACIAHFSYGLSNEERELLGHVLRP